MSSPEPFSPSPKTATAWIAAQFGTLALLLVVGPLWGGHWENYWSARVGRGLLILSGVIALGGFLSLGRNLTPNPQPRANATLVQHGIYAFIRHPLYCSLILGGFGWALLWRSVPALAAALVLAAVLNGKSRVEERFLRERFPEYATYSRKVRRFIPWVY
jgi:protein-S-isoprenylcysteine O-methyltransferase Ste14